MALTPDRIVPLRPSLGDTKRKTPPRTDPVMIGVSVRGGCSRPLARTHPDRTTTLGKDAMHSAGNANRGLDDYYDRPGVQGKTK
jgi:hypothetical protein